MNKQNRSTGSIGTTDEVFVFNFDAYKNKIPTNYPVPENSFLEWFIGFVEGDGCFAIQKPGGKRTNPHIFLTIGQKDRKPLDYIKNCLGFGIVSQ